MSRFMFVIGILLAIAASDVGAQSSGRIHRGLTRPSRDVDLVMRVSGVLAKLPVRSGQKVQQGDVIAELKSELEKQALEIARLKAESDHEVRIAETNKKLRQTELNQLKELESKDAASKWEVETTTVEVELEEVRAETARFNRLLSEADYKREQLLLAERTLLAPFDGVILRTLKEEGEGVADLEPIAVLVQLDPIWVECHLPAELFGAIDVGDGAQVRLDRAKSIKKVAQTSLETVPSEFREGVVVAADPLVDAASHTFRVVIEVQNEDGALAAGLIVAVTMND